MAIDICAVDGCKLSILVIEDVPLHAVLYAVEKPQCKSVNRYAIRPMFERQVLSP